MKRWRPGVDLVHPPPLHIFLLRQDEPASERLYGPFAKRAPQKQRARIGVPARVASALASRASQLSPALHVPFNTHQRSKPRRRNFGHIVAGRRAPRFLVSLPASIDGCPVSLSRRFRKHQALSDEVLTKGHRVAATEGKGADYREGGGGEGTGDGAE